MLRKLLAPLGHVTGAYARRWRSRAYHGCGLVLVYHRIAPRAGRGEPPGFGVECGLPVDVFEAQMRFLLARFRPLHMLDLLANQPAPDRVGFTVTFDDGYRDNLTLAAPVLAQLGIPATLFVTTDLIGTERLFWWEQLGELLRATREPALELGPLQTGIQSRWPVPDRLPLKGWRERETAHRLISMALMRTPPAEIDPTLAKLALALRAPRREAGRAAPLLNWDDVRRWRAAGFEVGAHGASHANLGLVSESEAQVEVSSSLAAVARETDAPARWFAYPYGAPEHRSPGAERALAAQGCPGAFTTDPGLVAPGSHRLRLPRIGLSSASPFACSYHVDQAFDSAHTRDAIAGREPAARVASPG